MLGARCLRALAVRAAARAPAAAVVPRRQVRAYSADLPDHIVVGMPALSPTMTQGTLASWAVNVGDEIEAGDSLGEIETDKASMSFDSAEDGYIAKLIAEPGTTCDLGVPLLVICEESGDVAAFADFVPPAAEAAAAPAEEAAPAPAAPTPAPAPTAATAPIVVAAGESALDAKLMAAAEAALSAKYPAGVPTTF
mmetsp:Transcript_95/g.215  ORF Transcript_95/g.215 Transcript_95/m.215 type:complete len:195 (+) Transcript_95:30-614(+)